MEGISRYAMHGQRGAFIRRTILQVLVAGTLSQAMAGALAWEPPTVPDRQHKEKIMSTDSIEQDIRLIVSGHFTPDALSPEVHGAVLERAKGHPGEYLTVFESMYLCPNFDPRVQSSLYLPTFLELMVDGEPERTRAIASHLLRDYDIVMVVYDDARDRAEVLKQLPDETVRFLQRLDIRRMELRGLLDTSRDKSK